MKQKQPKMKTTIALILGIISSVALILPACAQESLFIAYPPKDRQTTSDRIFIIGTATGSGQLLINNTPVNRSSGGHFAPSFPLKIGDNLFEIKWGDATVEITVKRTPTQPTIPSGVAFAPNSLTPTRDIARLPDSLICFGAVAPPNATVTVTLGTQTIPLLPENTIQLPPNNAVLTDQNQPQGGISTYSGCDTFTQIGNLGYPLFELNLQGKTITEEGKGKVEIIPPNPLTVVEVTATQGVARTGPSTNYSRLTPLLQRTQASVTGVEGEWLRLDYGGWIKTAETKPLSSKIPPRSFIRSISSRQVPGATEIVFPLQTPVPVTVKQSDKTFTLTLYNTITQTDTIYVNDDPIIQRLDWEQSNPTQAEYTFLLKSHQQWGYQLRYEATNLILTLRHPPQLSSSTSAPLEGISILLDPGHGGKELGATGPNGYPEKDANLALSLLLQQELIRLGATVYMTRETDIDVSLSERVEMINQLKPTLALSIHYNALPNNGDAINTAGIGMFWYHPQAHSLAVHLHNYISDKLNRPRYGIFWNNLTLTRPHAAPSILMELGFMINPVEFEWITNPRERDKLAEAIALGVVEWLQQEPQMHADKRR